jgi:magnesium transporter
VSDAAGLAQAQVSRVLLVYPDGVVETRADIQPDELPPGVITWISLRCSTEDAAGVLARWGFHRLAVEDVHHAQTRAKVERYPTHDFALIPALDPTTDDPFDTAGIYVFVRPALVVTNAAADVSAVHAAEEDVLRHPLRGGHHEDRIVHALVDAVCEEYRRAVEPLDDRLTDLVQRDIVGDATSEDIGEVVTQRTMLFRLRRVLLPLRETVQRLSDGATPETHLYFRDVLDHLNYMLDEAQLLVEGLNGRITLLEAKLREQSAQASTAAARANDRLNQVMKYMAVMSTLLLPMTIVSGAFGMNFREIPLSELQGGFWIATGLMVLPACGMLVVFRMRKWI